MEKKCWQPCRKGLSKGEQEKAAEIERRRQAEELVQREKERQAAAEQKRLQDEAARQKAEDQAMLERQQAAQNQTQAKKGTKSSSSIWKWIAGTAVVCVGFTVLYILLNTPKPVSGLGATISPTLLVVPTAPQIALATEIVSAAPAAAAKLKIGLVTDTGGVNDKSFNQSAWAGVEKAAKEFGYDVKFIESKQPTDYEKNIDQFATEKYDVVITVGFLMGDSTAAKAKQYPNIKFAIIDNSYYPTKDSAACPDTVKDCYADGGLKNVTSLMFEEDQVGFLAGVLAAGVSKKGTICTVLRYGNPSRRTLCSRFPGGCQVVQTQDQSPQCLYSLLHRSCQG